MPTRPRRLPAAVAAVAVVGQVLVLYWPVVSVQGPVSWTDKVVHGLVFLVPTYAVGRALQLAGRSAVAAVAVFLVHAPLSEVVQAVVLPGRSGDPWDVVLDVVGVAVAGWALARRRRASDGSAAGGPVVGRVARRW